MPRKKKEETAVDSAGSPPAPPPIENDIFADDVKWLVENNGKEVETDISPATLRAAAATSKFNEPAETTIVGETMIVGGVASPYTVPYTSPNTNPMPNSVPVYPGPIPTSPYPDQPFNPAFPAPQMPAYPSYPSLPMAPVVPSIPNYPSAPSVPNPNDIGLPIENKRNLMNNQQPDNSAKIFINETALWTTEWTIPTIYTLDAAGVEVGSYKDVVCSIHTYANDVYDIDKIAETSKHVFAMVHTVMDAIRKHADQIHPEGGINYLDTMDPGMLDLLTSFRKRMLDKRLGYPRITVKCRYGFKMPGSVGDIKIEAYEHTDPIDLYYGTMKYLETQRRIDTMHRKIAEKIAEQRREQFPVNNQQQTSAPAPQQQNQGYAAQSARPPANQQYQQQAPQQGQAPYQGRPPQNNPQQPPVDLVAGNILDCKTDEDAQNAPFNTLIAYHAVRVFRKDGKFNFYMPTGGDGRARPKGIYAYEQGKGASPAIENALKNGALPELQSGEATEWDVTIIALKLPTQSGNARYDIKDIIKY